LEVVSEVNVGILEDLLWGFVGEKYERAIEVARLVSFDGIPLLIWFIIQLVMPHVGSVGLEFVLTRRPERFCLRVHDVIPNSAFRVIILKNSKG
jgi:hypothetical protein